MGAGDTTIDPRDSAYAPNPGDFLLVAPRNVIPRPEGSYDHQPSGNDDTIQEPVPDCPTPATAASPGRTVYLPPFYQVPGARSSYRDPLPSHPPSSPLLNSGVVIPSLAYQNEGNELPTARLRQALFQNYPDTPNLSTTTVSMRGVGVDQHPSRYDHQPSRHGDTFQEPIPDYPSTAVASLPGVALYPGYRVSGVPSLCSPVNSVVALPAHPVHQNEVDELSIDPQLLLQTYQEIPTLSATAGPIGGVVDQHHSLYQCTLCDAVYTWPSALNRHIKDIHSPRIVCDVCGLDFPSGRKYLLTQHLERHLPFS